MQGHLHSDTFDPAALRNALEKLSQFNLPIRVTEFNMPGQRSRYYQNRSLRLTETEEKAKAQALVDYYRFCFSCLWFIKANPSWASRQAPFVSTSKRAKGMDRYLNSLCPTFKPQSAGWSLPVAPCRKKTPPSRVVTFETRTVWCSTSAKLAPRIQAGAVPPDARRNYMERGHPSVPISEIAVRRAVC